MAEAAVPTHIGYIIDGNRRWARQHGLPAYEGHLAGYNALQDVIQATLEAGVQFMSVYVFSTENWKRSKSEVNRLLGLILRLLTDDLSRLDEKGIKLCVLGSRDNLSDKLIQAIDKAETTTAGNTRGTLGVCFNYGGKQELVEASKKIVQSGVAADEVSADLIVQHLYAPEIPPLDLIVRTSGEQRLSNFMLWRAAYSELLFLDKLWPDMTKEDVSAILKEYARRSRRFGG